MLTYEQQKDAVALAMQIENGTIDLQDVLQTFQDNPNLANNLVYFWWSFNSMTRRAIDILIYQRYRMHLENCLKVNYE